MGGYVSSVASGRVPVVGILLLAPAHYLTCYREQYFNKVPDCPIEIVHGWRDYGVPLEHSIHFARGSGSALHLLDDDHRFSSKLDVLGELLTPFLQKLGSVRHDENFAASEAF